MPEIKNHLIKRKKPWMIIKEFIQANDTKFGGDKRDRTADLLHAMQALYQLSYTP